ncbi:MAG: helix-turn-helix domain-containing protein, partial [Terriglobia bacterium]
MLTSRELTSGKCTSIISLHLDGGAMASFGDSLRRERELRGTTLAELASATKISLRYLQALERDQFD